MLGELKPTGPKGHLREPGRPAFKPRRGTSLIRNSARLGPYSSTIPRALWWSLGRVLFFWSLGGVLFFMSEVPLSARSRSPGPDSCPEARHWQRQFDPASPGEQQVLAPRRTCSHDLSSERQAWVISMNSRLSALGGPDLVRLRARLVQGRRNSSTFI